MTTILKCIAQAPRTSVAAVDVSDRLGEPQNENSEMVPGARKFARMGGLT